MFTAEQAREFEGTNFELANTTFDRAVLNYVFSACEQVREEVMSKSPRKFVYVQYQAQYADAFRTKMKELGYLVLRDDSMKNAAFQVFW